MLHSTKLVFISKNIAGFSVLSHHKQHVKHKIVRYKILCLFKIRSKRVVLLLKGFTVRKNIQLLCSESMYPRCSPLNVIYTEKIVMSFRLILVGQYV